MELTPLYHWSPSDRREMIRQEGLRPRMPGVVTREHTQLHICLSTNPQIAWSISGAMDWVAEIEHWDLWLVHIGQHDQVTVLPARVGPADPRDPDPQPNPPRPNLARRQPAR